ncbi:MAG: T9SS type A sorting domain-containing protein [bacterium]|nr:T9SS type A sorting domain-containing protein [bacterium]
MKLHHAAAFAVLLVAAAGPAAAGWIGQVVVGEPGGSRLPNGAVVLVDFDYKITNPGGARFRVAPQSGGATVAGFVGDVSAVLPAGTGHRQLGFTFTSGSRSLDHCLVEMVTPDQVTTLLEISVPAVIHYGDHAVHHLQPSTASPAWLKHGEAFTLAFDAASTRAGGVYVLARPFSGGTPVPGVVTSGGSFVVGSGSGSQWFRFDGGAPHVDSIRLQMWNAAMTELLLEFFIPADLRGARRAQPVIAPGAHEQLGHGQTVLVDFDYATSATAGVQVWARGVDAGGQPVPDQSYAPSPVLAATAGHLSRWFTIVAGEREVPYLQILMVAAGSGAQLLDVRLPVGFAFGPHAVNGVTYVPALPAVLDPGEQVTVSFAYATTEAAGARIWALPRTDDAYTPAYFNGTSPLYPIGEGDGGGWFSVSAGSAVVDQVEFLITDRYLTRTLSQSYRDAHFAYGAPAFVTAAPPLLPSLAVLGRCRPNPFNPATTIPVELGAASAVKLAVYDLRGQLVRTLVDGVLPAGRTEVEFRADGLGSGTYLYTLECAGTRQSRRLVLVR